MSTNPPPSLFFSPDIEGRTHEQETPDARQTENMKTTQNGNRKQQTETVHPLPGRAWNDNPRQTKANE